MSGQKWERRTIEEVADDRVIVIERDEKTIVAARLPVYADAEIGSVCDCRELWGNGCEGDAWAVKDSAGRVHECEVELYVAGTTPREIAETLDIDEDDAALGMM